MIAQSSSAEIMEFMMYDYGEYMKNNLGTSNL